MGRILKYGAGINIQILLFLLYFSLMGIMLMKGDTINMDKNLSSHPRLIFADIEKDKIFRRLKTDINILKIHDSIISECGTICELPLLKRKLTGIRLLSVSREALKRIFYLSYTYRITEELQYADRAIAEMVNVCGFEDWNPNHFLDVAEMTMAIAIGYDWLYDVIPSDKKRIIVDAIYKKAFIPSRDPKLAWFYNAKNNWNSVCNAGLLYGAIAVYNELPDISDAIIRRCIDSNPNVMSVYAPDGCYPEGYNYWGYGTLFQVLIIDALERNFGNDFGLSGKQGFLQSAKFMQFISAPSGDCFNFSDSPLVDKVNIPMWWFAKRNNDVSLLYVENMRLDDNIVNVAEARFLPLLPIFASRLDAKDIAMPTENYWFGNGVTPIFVYRSGWNRSMDSYLAVKGGSPSTSHAHMDAGSFVYEYAGVRWASDLGMQDYNSLESKGVKVWDSSQNGQRWEVMRMRNDFHNTLTVDSGLHIVKSNAQIKYTFCNPSRKGAVVDLTSSLGKLKMARREISLDSDDHLIVIDSLCTKDYPTDISWIMVTYANARVVNDSCIELKKGDRFMYLKLDTKESLMPQILSNKPVHRYDASNGESVRVGFTGKLSPNKECILKVTLSPADSV